MHLGYRKLASGPGNWLLRHYQGKGAYRLKNIGTADDYSDADGQGILNFAQAQEKARDEATVRRGPYTVAQALEAYFEALSKVKAERHVWFKTCGPKPMPSSYRPSVPSGCPT